jgi:hypothetical protein
MNDGTSEKRDIDRRKLRKITELSLGIPIIAICLLVSPLLNGFTKSDGQTEFAFVMIYIFGVWGALILMSFIMSRLLSSGADKR